MIIKQKIKTFIRKHKVKLGVLFVLFIGWFFCLPNKLFTNPTSTVVTSQEGFLLGARIANDGQWRFPKADSVPKRFEACILQFEDEYFYYHPGFNPVSIAKAFWQNITTNKRRGGSTITQQVIRLSRENKPRSYTEKLIEVFQATRLEARSSKKEILSLYASHAPFGGNVVGLETASWRYFGIPAHQLSWGQAAALAVLPNAPALIFPGKNETAFLQKRNNLLSKLLQNKIIDTLTYELAIAEKLPGSPVRLPNITPHLTEKIRKQHNGQQLQTTIDYLFQKKVNAIVKKHHNLLQQNEINNLAVLVVNVNTKHVIAYVGNSPTTPQHHNYVDIINKPRSTGSVLKPFLFASLMDAGELLPNTLVTDVPTVINGYSPENYTKTFTGAVPASVALAQSLNVPAVRMLRSYGLQRFYNQLKKLRFTNLRKPADYYGLSLILGGAECSLWEITSAYASMAETVSFFNQSSSEYRTHEYAFPTFLNSKKAEVGQKTNSPPVFDAGAIYLTLDALQRVNRPHGQENWSFFSSAQPIAWKTGTSFGFKDAWAVGVTPQYAIGVWVGNADGEGRPGLTGIQAAAPVLFDVLESLPNSGSWFDPPYDEMKEVSVCTKSGYLSGVYCTTSEKKWIAKNGIKTGTCPYHHPVLLDATRAFRVNSSCYELAAIVRENRFSLPPVLEYYYAPNHPEYQPLPPFKQGCLKEGEKIMEVIFPKKNEAILLPKMFNETTGEVIFKLAHQYLESTVYWYLDNLYLGSTQTFHELALKPKPGKYTLTVIDQEGNELKQLIEVVGVE